MPLYHFRSEDKLVFRLLNRPERSGDCCKRGVGLSRLINKKQAFRIWICFLGVPIVLGCYAAVIKFISAEEIYGTTQLVPLGILISTYIFFVVSSTGLCMVTSLGHVFRVKRFELIARRGVYLAIITLLCGFGAISLEIERPFRLIAHIITSPQFTAPIWWMGVFYSLYLIFLIFEFAFLLKHKAKKAQIFGLAAFLSGVTAHSTLGAIFGVMQGRPYWYGPYLPIYFIISAIVSGTAFILFFTIITYRTTGDEFPSSLKMLFLELGKFLALFIGIALFCMTWKIIMSLYGHPHLKYEAVMALLNGPLSFNFWVFEVFVGSLVPFFILLIPGKLSIQRVFVAATLVITGMFFVRYDLVVVGQIYPVWGGKYASYSPNHLEWIVLIACIGACLLFYTLGVRFLPLKEELD